MRTSETPLRPRPARRAMHTVTASARTLKGRADWSSVAWVIPRRRSAASITKSEWMASSTPIMATWISLTWRSRSGRGDALD
eukprot:scaffold68901_cov30-Tisochrysis_lutea.AAC.4